jgi:hypothetical protein
VEQYHVACDRDYIGKHEKFTVMRHSDERISLKTHYGYYISVGDGGVISCGGEQMAPAEIFIANARI